MAEAVGLVAITVLTAVIEHRCPMAEYAVADAGFVATRCLHAFLARHSRVAFVLAMMNSLLMVSCVSFWGGRLLGAGVTSGFRALVLVLVVRALVGALTRLPRPPGWLACWAELPPGPANFFFVVSGHTAMLYSTAMEMQLHWAVVAALLGAQSTRILAARGHYTADLVVGLVLTMTARHALKGSFECFT
jgi:hypothetical protein